MAHDPKQIEQLARTYTEAWCSRDPARGAGHYVPGGTISINGGDAAGIADVAEAFIAAFPDIEVFMDDRVLRDDGSVEYRWTFTGTSTETGKSLRVPGFEEWTIAPDGLMAESCGHYDQAGYDHQVRHGIGPALRHALSRVRDDPLLGLRFGHDRHIKERTRPSRDTPERWLRRGRRASASAVAIDPCQLPRGHSHPEYHEGGPHPSEADRD